MKNKKIFLAIILVTISLIFSMGVTCRFCGTRVQVNPDNGVTTIDNGIIAQNSGAAVETSGAEITIVTNVPDNPGDNNNPSGDSNNPGETSETSYGNNQEEKPGTDNQTTFALKDKRFAIIIETMQNRGTEYSYAKGNDPNFFETRDYFLKMGIPPEQIYIYWGQDEQGGTYGNFLNAVNSVAKISGKDCTVIVAFMTHGSEASAGYPAMIEFANGHGNEHGGNCVSYLEISTLLDTIACEKMAVMVSSCAMTDSVDPLAAKPTFPRVAMAPITLQEILNYILTEGDAVDRNKDKMISIKDVYDFVKDPSATLNPARYEDMLLLDNFGISDLIYLN